MARVIEIVKAHLEAQGFDGLVQTDAEAFPTGVGMNRTARTCTSG